MDWEDEEIVNAWKDELLCMRKLDTGEWIGVLRRMYNTLMVIGLDPYGYRDGF